MSARLLHRQLERAFGRTEGLEPSLDRFVAMVEATYLQAEEERRMNEHVARLSSQELYAAHAQLRSLMKALPDTYINMLTDGTVKDCQGAELSGAPVWSLIGRKLSETCLAQAAERIMDAAAASRESGKVQQLDVQLGEGVGASYYDVRVAPTEEGSSAVVLRDVTVERRAQAQLAQAQKLEAIGQLAAGIAHEINTPTQYIGDNIRFLRDSFCELEKLLDAVESIHEMGGVEALDEARRQLDLGFLRSEWPSALTQSLEGVERVTHIVYSMKEFAHPDRGEKEAVDLNRAVRSATTVCRNEWKYLADLEHDLSPELPPILAFAGDIGQIVLNLVVNAAHAIKVRFGDGPKRGRITVRTRCEHGRALLEVSDNGSGISEEHKPRIFEQFFTTKPVGKGTGQGLALVRRMVVDRHGGRVGFDTEVGTGTTFRIELPLETPDS